MKKGASMLVFAWTSAVSLSSSIISVIGISSDTIINENENNVTNTTRFPQNGWTFVNVSWIYLFLYTLSVAIITYYLLTCLQYANTSTINSSSSYDSFHVSLKKRLLRIRSQFKFLVISRIIHSRNGLNELHKKLQLTLSESESVDTKYESQRNELADAILKCYICSWYNNISDDKAFLDCSKQILLFIFKQLGTKAQQVDRTTLAKELILLLHCHWTEYCEMLSKSPEGSEDPIINNFKAVHPYFDKMEELSKQYQALLSLLLEEIIIADLQTPLFCQFLSGILVKGLIFYYANLLCNPNWLNAALISIISVPVNSNKATTEDSSLDTIMQPNSDTNQVADELNTPIENENVLQENSSQPEFICSVKTEEMCSKSPEKGVKSVDAKFSSSTLVGFPISKLAKQENLVSISNSNNQKLTICSALSGLLVTAAIPLLPDGSTYDISDLESNSSSIADNNESPVELPRFSGFDEPIELEKVRAIDEEEGNEVTNNKLHGHKIRHFSVNDAHKQRDSQNQLEKSTQSLDENRISHKSLDQDSLLTESPNKKMDASLKKSASPMYEETEDFAATIAKLRTLLEQKQSRSNLMEGSQSDAQTTAVSQNEEIEVDKTTEASQSTDTTEILKDNLSRSSSQKSHRQNLNSQSSVASAGAEGSNGSGVSQSSLELDKMDTIEDELDDADLVLRRIFLNVSIYKTEACGDSSTQSILFCIQYEGVYMEEDDSDNSQKLVLRTTTVKRRFKEFLTLQSQLEENPIWKPHLKQIKTPSKWLTLSFPNQNSINQRKLFLEKYLQQICYHPILGFSPELRQFMAYGDDGFRTFEMLTSNSLSFHRFDKLAKKFTGVFNSLKDVLPSFEGDAYPPAPNSPDEPQTENKERFSPNDPKAKKMFASFFNFGEKVLTHKTKQQELLLDIEHNQKSSISPSSSGKGDLEVIDAYIDFNEKEEKTNSSDEENATPGEGELVLDGSYDSIYPLASVFTQLLCDVLWLPPHRPHVSSIAAFMSISGKSLENYLQESLKVLLSEDAFAVYLDWITCSINEWMATDPVAAASQEDIIPECTQTELKNCLRQRIPSWARWMWGRKRLELTIDRLSGFCQHAELNHDFVLSMVELVFSKLTENCNEKSDNAVTEEETK